MRHPSFFSMLALVSAVFCLSGCSFGSQVPDLDYRFPVEPPRFAEGAGPRVAIDEAHGNFHTFEGRFGPFARLLADDGYRVSGFASLFSAESLAEVDILVIANPLAEENQARWRLPNYGAFAKEEITALREWLEAGGSLLLIADHMPFPAAAEEVAAELGFFFANGYAQDEEGNGHIVYTRENGTLQEHPITDGFEPGAGVEQVKVFTGQGFRALPDLPVEPLMVMPPGSRVWLPSKPRDLTERTPYVPAEGLWQGAVMPVGLGRLAVFGEAAMFTAQLSITRKSERRIGISAEGAEQNARFVLNVLAWLAAADSDR